MLCSVVLTDFNFYWWIKWRQLPMWLVLLFVGSWFLILKNAMTCVGDVITRVILGKLFNLHDGIVITLPIKKSNPMKVRLIRRIIHQTFGEIIKKNCDFVTFSCRSQFLLNKGNAFFHELKIICLLVWSLVLRRRTKSTDLGFVVFC